VKVIHTISDFRRWRSGLERDAATPFAPTMGALHEGHISLVQEARVLAGASGKVLSSIFVNPTQFGPTEDFSKYPRTLEADVKMLQAAGCDVVFVPSAQEMYATDQPLNAATQATLITIDPGPIGDVLEGAIRPGHFRGVCTVVAKLLNIVQPSHLLLGQKDFQQQAILRKMCAELNMPVEVITCPTMREPDGLAMSSRNRYLSADERPRAAAIYEALRWTREAFINGERRPEILEQAMGERIENRGLIVEYAVAANPATLVPWKNSIGGSCVLLIAAKLGSTRLIDNLLCP
jgi:pantoate--beta-alanine ligase